MSKETLFKALPVIILSSLLVVAIIYAWTEPTVAPPGGNVAAPLNVSINAQAKEGALIVGNNSAVPTGLIVRYGNVGIGTTTPATKLDVVGTVKMTGFRLGTSAIAGYVLTANASGVGTWQPAAGGGGLWTDAGTYIYANNATNVVVTDTGNVGIGTNNPIVKLQVSGGNIYLSNTDTWGVSMIVRNDSGGNTWRWVTGGASGDGNVPAGGMAIHHDGLNSPFQIKNDGTIFMNVGNVGIGTTGPGAALDVKGGVDGTNMFIRNSTGQTTNYLSFYEITGNQWNVGNYATSKFAIFQNGTAPGNSGIIFSGGNVGIGTTDPQTKLHVAGNARITGLAGCNGNQNIEVDAQGNLVCGADETGGGGVSNPSKNCGGGNAIQSFDVTSGAQQCISVPSGIVGIQNCHTESTGLVNPPVTINCGSGIAVSGGFERFSTITTGLDHGPAPSSNGWRCGGNVSYVQASGYCRVRCCQ